MVASGIADVFFVGGLAVFVGHFEEQQVGELFEVVAIADTIIPEDVAEAPNFGNDAGSAVHGWTVFPLAKDAGETQHKTGQDRFAREVLGRFEGFNRLIGTIDLDLSILGVDQPA